MILDKNIDQVAGLKLCTVIGNSMNPQLESGDIIIIKKVPYDKIIVGDIISYYQGSMMVTHRIKEIKDGKFITIGDNNQSLDNIAVDYSNIVGKYILNIPKGDYIISLSRNPFFAFIIFLLLLINISFLFKIFKEKI